MEIIFVFALISIIIFLGFFAEQFFKKTNVPDIIFLLLIGIILGSILKWTNASYFGEAASLFTTFALIFILFQGSLGINFKTLFKSLKNTFILTTVNFILTVLVVSVISYFLGYNILLSILIGMILGGTSSAVVIPLVENIEIKEKYGLVLTLESALSDVFCIIGTVTILEIITTNKIIASNIFRTVLSSFSLALFVGLIGGFLWVLLLSKNENLARVEIITVAFLLGLYSFVESSFVSASGAIAALAFGLILGNSKTILDMKNRKKRLETSEGSKNVINSNSKNFYSEISFFVKTFFFVYLGILIDFSNLIVFFYGFILTLGMYLIRPLSVIFTFRKDKFVSVKERTFLEVLIPKGLAAAVLIGVAVQSGVFENRAGEVINLILSVVLLSIIFTSILIFLTEKDWFKGFLPFLHKKVLKK